MARYEALPIDEARDRLTYDAATGRFTIRRHIRCPSLSGRPTHCLDVGGYVQVNLAPYGPIKGHRLAWFMHYGEWPGGHIDHINGIRDDNRIVNLRVVTNAINCQNKRLPLPSNKTGFLGVHFANGVYRAAISVNRKQHHLGSFKTPELAHEAYVDAKRRMHEGCEL